MSKQINECPIIIRNCMGGETLDFHDWEWGLDELKLPNLSLNDVAKAGASVLLAQIIEDAAEWPNTPMIAFDETYGLHLYGEILDNENRDKTGLSVSMPISGATFFFHNGETFTPVIPPELNKQTDPEGAKRSVLILRQLADAIEAEDKIYSD